MKLPRISPLTRLSLGLTSLVVSLLLLLDVSGLLPDQTAMVKQVRNRTSEALAIQAAALLRMGDIMALGRSLEAVRERDDQIRSIAVREKTGRILVAVGEHGRYWVAPEGGRSSLDHIQVPVFANQQEWGAVEISFVPALPNTLMGWLRYPTVVMLLAMGALGFVAFFLYMRRALQYLDPSTAVPERVKHAFDTLTDGIAILDREGRIMLTNDAFAKLHPDATQNLVGKKLDEQAWLCGSLESTAVENLPWQRAMHANAVQSGVFCNLRQPGGESFNIILQASPILDPKGVVRGCLVSFDDVTQVHQVNEELRGTLAELEVSREQIRSQNEELQHLASRDPLTGCLNRRAFFDLLEDLFVVARDQGHGMCCIMTDIDHFKQFNDRYGHAVGDEVIRAIVRTLQAGLRNDDLLCRYGGEEFCIILPDTNMTQALEIANRLRADVEERAGRSVRTTEGLKITASFGVAALGREMRDPAELIDRADTAMYKSKKAGRNQVTSWRPGVAPELGR
ncbi:MAG: diguanylate cyclase [Hydrogenophilales bacterium]|nr:diguanylate cyclase [Hydrogenophilales bacterium]